MWLEEESVHVGQLDLVVVEEDEFPDAAAGEHLGSDAAHAPDAHHRHAEIHSLKDINQVSTNLQGIITGQIVVGLGQGGIDFDS